MHCTINRKYLRYFERNPRNIVNICANIYGIFNGFERGLLPFHKLKQIFLNSVHLLVQGKLACGLTSQPSLSA